MQDDKDLRQDVESMKIDLAVQQATNAGAQATQAATQAGQAATQAATQAGQAATQAAMQAGTTMTMVAGFVALIVGIFLGILVGRR